MNILERATNIRASIQNGDSIALSDRLAVIFQKDPAAEPPQTEVPRDNGQTNPSKMSFLDSFKMSNISSRFSNSTEKEEEKEADEEFPPPPPRRPSQVEMFVNARIATFMVNMDAITDTEARLSTFRHNLEMITDMLTGRERKEDPAAEEPTSADPAKDQAPQEDAGEEKKEEEEAL